MSTATPAQTISSFGGAFASMAADRAHARREAREDLVVVRHQEQDAMARLAREIAALRQENENLRRRAETAEARADRAVQGLLIATGRA